MGGMRLGDDPLGKSRRRTEDQIVFAEVKRLEGHGIEEEREPVELVLEGNLLQEARPDVPGAVIGRHGVRIVGGRIDRGVRKHVVEDLDDLFRASHLHQEVVHKRYFHAHPLLLTLLLLTLLYSSYSFASERPGSAPALKMQSLRATAASASL